MARYTVVLSVANMPNMLSVIVLSVIMLSVIILSVINLSVIMLNVVMLCVMAPFHPKVSNGLC